VQGTALPPAGATSTPAPPPAPAAAPSADAAGLGLIWPASGTVIGTFNETTNKGVDIAGKAGDPVVAAAAGKVIYVGEVRGYGQLIIIQHSKDYLTAYGHNQKLLVKDDQNVKKGQNIAEMGSTDTDRVKLHFELRRQGKPIDPLRYLPKR
jgi:lipoprotein NlpD